jgi:glycosyltransferase involved in cell wall biosynthesis
LPRVLWIGDAGCHTGFGRVTHAIGDRLVTQHGHDVHTLAINFDGDAGNWPTPMKLYRANKLNAQDLYGTSRYVEMLAEILPDVVVMLQDPFAVMKLIFRNKHDTDLILSRFRPLIAYLPIDGINQPQTWQKLPKVFAEQLEPMTGGTGPSFHPVAMSKFGQSILGDVPLIYHGVDTDTYHPVSIDTPMTSSTGLKVTSKREAKLAVGVDPNGFMVLRVDRNSERKNYSDTWRALVPLMKKHPNMHAWFHCKGQGDGMELPELFSRDEETAQRFTFPGKHNTITGWKEQDLAILYNAADLFVSTSWGEGFGLTLAEAASSGLPIVAQNCSSITEVVGPGGLLIQPERLIAVFAGHDQWLPDVPAFTNAIDALYNDPLLRSDLAEAGRDHVITNFSWDTAASQFSELITGLAQQPAGSPGGPHARSRSHRSAPAVNRAARRRRK